jgi:hypothetical protein
MASDRPIPVRHMPMMVMGRRRGPLVQEASRRCDRCRLIAEEVFEVCMSRGEALVEGQWLCADCGADLLLKSY